MGFKKNEKFSFLDLLQKNWILLTQDKRWKLIVDKAIESLGIDLECLTIGIDFVTSDDIQFLKAFGLKEGGASLIRPDGYVAWRTVDLPNDPTSSLIDALYQVSSSTKIISKKI